MTVNKGNTYKTAGEHLKGTPKTFQVNTKGKHLETSRKTPWLYRKAAERFYSMERYKWLPS